MHDDLLGQILGDAPGSMLALQPADWADRERFVHRPLYDRACPWMPWVVLGETGPDRGWVPAGGSTDETEGLATLASLDIGAERPESAYPFAVLRHPWAAEKILDPVAMGQLAELLGCEEILVAIPTRGELRAAPVDLEPPFDTMFLQVATERFADDPGFGITPLVFRVRAGGIIGFEPVHDPRGLLGARPRATVSHADDAILLESSGGDWGPAFEHAITTALHAMIGIGSTGSRGLVITFQQAGIPRGQLQKLAAFMGANNHGERARGACTLTSVATLGPDGDRGLWMPSDDERTGRRLPWGLLIVLVIFSGLGAFFLLR